MPFQSSARGKYGAQSMKPTKGPLAPVWVTSGTIGTNVPQGQAYSVQLSATDDSLEQPIYSLASGSLPTGTTLSSTGLISGTPSAAGDFSFTVSARDGNGRTTTSGNLLINVQSSLKQPQIWYKNSRVGQNPITNDGTFGTGYNTPANPSTTTDSGRNVWNMGSSYFEFPLFNITPYANGYAAWTFAVVMRTSTNMQKWSLLGSPTGSSQIVGSANRAANNFEVSYNNDGYPFFGSTINGNVDTTSNMCQLVIRYDGITYNGSGRLQVWGPSRTSGAVYDNYLSNNGGFNYASQIDHNRVGWSRGTQDTTWYLAEYLFYQGVVTDAEITQIRTYLGSTHPVGVVNN
jgi:hypothetical protein